MLVNGGGGGGGRGDVVDHYLFELCSVICEHAQYDYFLLYLDTNIICEQATVALLVN